MDNEEDVNTFLLERVLPKFVDVVDMKDVGVLFKWFIRRTWGIERPLYYSVFNPQRSPFTQ
jgi:hypothetical protein